MTIPTPDDDDPSICEVFCGDPINSSIWAVSPGGGGPSVGKLFGSKMTPVCFLSLLN